MEEKKRKASTGYRLTRERAGALRRYLTNATSVIQGQSYEPRAGGSRSPLALFSLERYVQSGGSVSKQARAVCAAFDALPSIQTPSGERPMTLEEIVDVISLLYGPREGHASLRGVREATDVGGNCYLCGLWCYEKPREKGTMKPDGATELAECEWCREFGDAVLLVRRTETARARARTVWASWMCNEGTWGWARRSRTAAAELQAYYESLKQAHLARLRAGAGLELEEDEGPPFERNAELDVPFEEWSDYRARRTAKKLAIKSGALFHGTALEATGAMLEHVERRRHGNVDLDAIAEDVIERAIRPRTRDDVLLHAIRIEAHQRVALASRLFSAAWDVVDDRIIDEEKKRVHGDVIVRQRIRASSRKLGTRKPTTVQEQIEALDELIEYARANP